MLGSALLAFAPVSVAAVQVAPAQDALLAVSLNGELVDDAVQARVEPDSQIYILLSDLQSWRLVIPASARQQADAAGYLPLNAIPGLTARYNSLRQTVELTATAQVFSPTKIDYNERDVGRMTRSPFGAYLNYDFTWAHFAGQSDLSALAEFGAFEGNGSGSTTFVFGGAAGRHALRLDSSWTFYNADEMSSVRIGDSISRGSAVAPPYRFAGIQVSRDFGISPGYLTMPLPQFSGSASLPSTIDVISNGNLLSSRPISPGPFQLINLPVTDGSGQVQIVVRDLLGRESVAALDVYTSSALLRSGLTDYSYELGFLRHGFGTESFDYGRPVASATYRRGLTGSFTGELHADISAERQLTSAAATIETPLGILDIGTGASHSDLGFGEMAQAGLQFHSPRFNFGLGGTYFSKEFEAGDDVVARPKSLVRASAHASFGSASLGLTYVDRSYWNAPRFALLSAGGSVSAGHMGYFTFSAFHGVTSNVENGFSFGWSHPLGDGINATLRAERRGSDQTAETSVQRNLPVGDGFGFRAVATAGDRPRQAADLLYQNSMQTYELEVGHDPDNLGIRAGVTGAIALIGQDLIAARRLTDSFAVVDAGYKGVRVYSDNHLVGRTNGNGVLVVPNIRAFDKTTVRIEQGDLPIEAKTETIEKTLRPYRGAGVRLDYKVQLTHDALLSLVLDDGSAVPAGAVATIDGRDQKFAGTPEGQFYLLDLQRENNVTVRWDRGECMLKLNVPAPGFADNDAGKHICARQTR